MQEQGQRQFGARAEKNRGSDWSSRGRGSLVQEQRMAGAGAVFDAAAGEQAMFGAGAEKNRGSDWSSSKGSGSVWCNSSVRGNVWCRSRGRGNVWCRSREEQGQ